MNSLQMSGWKTKAGGIGLIATGIGILINCYSSGNWEDAGQGIAAITAGLAAIGIGHKVEKGK
jgi:hypothetical protein